MRVYNYKLNEGSLTITVDEVAGAISGICVEGNEVSLPEGCEEEAIRHSSEQWARAVLHGRTVRRFATWVWRQA